MSKNIKRYRLLARFGDRRKWVEGRSKEDVIRKRAELIAEWKLGMVTLDGSMTFREWTREWAKAYRGDISPAYLYDQESVLRVILFPQLGSRRMDSIRPLHLQQLFRNLEDKSFSYNHKVYILLNQILRAAVENDIIRKNPLSVMKCPKGKGSGKRRSITEEERVDVIAACDNMLARGLLPLIVLFCGLRPGEAAALLWEDVDFSSGYISVIKAVKRSDAVGPPKSEAGNRRVPIPEGLRSRLLPFEASPGDLVCTNTQGGRLTPSSIEDLWKSVIREINIEKGCAMKNGRVLPPYLTAPDLTLYCLRHTYCTDLETAGVPINIARRLMGHSNISVTAQIYTHTSDAALEDARSKIDRFQNTALSLSNALPIAKANESRYS